jgi:energy-coupling factor transporter ATP-binding protein EcfA2
VEPAVSVQDLAYTYRGQKEPALDGVSLDVAQGEFVVVMGHSGAGKSTLCTSLNGLIPHFFRGRMQGEVRIEGRSTREGKVGEFAKDVGLVFQDFEAQLFSTNVALEVAFGPENFEVEREEMVRRVETVLGQVRLEGFEGRQPATLSGGQKQRLAIASVLAMEPRILCLDEPTTDLDPIGMAVRPEVLILDEPTTGLDYAEQRSMMDLVRRLNEAGSTIIVVTHTMWVVAEYAHRAVAMKDGKMALSGPVREVFTREVELRDAALRPPHIVSLGNSLGYPVLSVEEMQMWGAFFRREENMEQNTNSGKKLVVYVAIAILASIICAVWIAWFNDLLGNVPFTVLASIISINNAIVGVVLGPILLLVLYPRVKRWGLLWTEIMEPDEVPASRLQTVGNVLMWVGGSARWS